MTTVVAVEMQRKLQTRDNLRRMKRWRCAAKVHSSAFDLATRRRTETGESAFATSTYIDVSVYLFQGYVLTVSVWAFQIILFGEIRQQDCTKISCYSSLKVKNKSLLKFIPSWNVLNRKDAVYAPGGLTVTQHEQKFLQKFWRRIIR